MDLDELIDRACPIIGAMGWAFYFVPETGERGKALGLDPISFYFLGRGGVLGDVEAPVIQSAFGYFEPTLLANIWNAAKAVAEPRQAAREFMAAGQDFGRKHFSDLPDLDAFCAAAETVSSSVAVPGLSLFAGVAAEPLCEDLPGRAMQLVTTLREFRGSVHLLAVVASGVSVKVAHYLRRPGDMALFGYSEAQIPEATEADRQRLADADALTDRLVRPAYSVLDEQRRTELVAGLERMETVLIPAG